jgi:hypothetical protein
MDELIARFRAWRARRQAERCARGYHHYRSLTPDRMRCLDPGCGKWYGR